MEILQETERTKPVNADRVMVTYYTDPLCCWSWALEQHWKKLREEFQGLLKWKYVMGGMIPDWKNYNDPMNAVNRPIQLGPVWMHASQVTETPIDYSIWHKDPPASSYPCCIAVKCAQQQSPQAGEVLLYALRQAVMTNCKNISREDVIMQIAGDLAKRKPEVFSDEKFRKSWEEGSGSHSFLDDLRETRFLRIGRYPTVTFSNGGVKGIIITGYRPYEILKSAMLEMARARGSREPMM